MQTAEQSELINDMLPPLECDRTTFRVDYRDGFYTKYLLIDGYIVHALKSAREPDDYRVYATYLSVIRHSAVAEEYMLKNLNDRQLAIVISWLQEQTKVDDGKDSDVASSYKAKYSHIRIDDEKFQLFNHLVSVRSLVHYEPNSKEMISLIEHLAASLEQRQASKAARKLRLAGNLIPRNL